uniref:DEAD-box helicase 42 n=1 Tax=Sarcophilus harrisii TaxID=9305 RepID=A0A7N4PLN7_SARHA
MNWNKGGPGTKRGFGFGGFAIAAGKKEEPKLPQQSHSAFGATSSSAGFGKSAPPQLPSFYKIGSKRANFDEENAYFEDEEEDSSNVDLPYIPAENSPTRQQFHSKSADSDSDDDPLEAFMAEVEARLFKYLSLEYAVIGNKTIVVFTDHLIEASCSKNLKIFGYLTYIFSGLM